MQASKTENVILWRQVFGLATVQGAISFTWLIYRMYLPQLLASFGFPGLDQVVQIIEDALAMIMEPITGGISDRTKQFMGIQFPLIVLGIILSSVLFIAIPTVFIFAQPLESLHWLLPVVLILWAVAMAIFRSPTLALIGKAASQPQLPQAASVLILIGGIVGAFKSIANNFILNLGPGFAFFIGSVVLLGAMAVLRSVFSHTTTEISENANTAESVSSPALVFLFTIAFGIAWGVRLGMGALPGSFKTQFPQQNTDVLMFVVSLILAFLALPAGKLAVRLGNQKCILFGLITTAIMILAIEFFPSVLVGEVIVFIVALSFVLNGVIPLALSLVSPQRGGLAIGMYFGGFTGAMSLFNYLFPKSLPSPQAALVGAIALFIAAAGVIFSNYFLVTSDSTTP